MGTCHVMRREYIAHVYKNGSVYIRLNDDTTWVKRYLCIESCVYIFIYTCIWSEKQVAGGVLYLGHKGFLTYMSSFLQLQMFACEGHVNRKHSFGSVGKPCRADKLARKKCTRLSPPFPIVWEEEPGNEILRA